LGLTSAARAALQAIEAEVEPTLAGDGELAPLADWGAKYVGAIARIAGNLHMASYDSVTTALREDVSEQTVLAAARIGEYFKAGAINAFIDMGVDQVAADAAYLLERIVSEGRDEVSERDLFTMSSRARFRKMADLAPVLRRLIDHRYLAAMPARPQGSDPGRRPSIRYKVHPHAAKTAKTPQDAAAAGEEGVFAVSAAPSELHGGQSANQQAQTDAPPPAEHQQCSASTAGAPVESVPTPIGVVQYNGQQPSSADTAEVSSGFAARSVGTG
jgi:hypothetical protein